jgi:hypothetical protein
MGDPGTYRPRVKAGRRTWRGKLSAVARTLNKGRTQIMRWVAHYDIDVNALRH